MRRALPGLLFALLVIGVYADPLFLRRNFAGRDLLAYNLPIEKAVHDAYARGRLPVWFDEVSGGRPLLPNPNFGALYPIRPMLSLIPFPTAARLFPIIHWILAGWGVIALLRTVGASREAAWLGAVTYTFSGVGASEVFFPNLQPGMTLLPWIVWAVARPARPAAARTLLLATFFTLSLLAGDVFTIGVAVVCALSWIALETDRSRRLSTAGSLAGALALAALAAAPQILATALWLPETRRAVIGMKLGESVFGSLPPIRLLELFVPFPFGRVWSLDDDIWAWPVFHGQSVGFFATLFAGSFAAFALFTLWRSRGPGLRFARFLFLFGVLVSALPSLTPEPWKGLSSPIALRNPEKFAVAIVFSLALFAGLAWDLCRRSPPRARWALAISGLFAVLALAVAAAPETGGRIAAALTGGASDSAHAGGYLPGALAEAGLLWISALLAIALLRRSARAATVGALLLLTAAPIAASRRIGRTFREEAVFAPTAFARMIRRLDPDGAYRTLGAMFRPTTADPAWTLGPDPGGLEISRREWYEFAHAIWNRGTVLNLDFDHGDLSRVDTLRLMSLAAVRSQSSSPLFGSLSLRFGVRRRGEPPLPGFRRFGGDASHDFEEHELAYPDIRMAQRWTETTGGIPALREIGRMRPGEILVESGIPRNGVARPGRIQILEKTPERLLIDVSSLDPTWLFVLRAYWEHRTVRMDGRPTEVLPAQIGFSAVAVPAGVHRIDWRECVPGGRFSRWGPILSLAAAGALIARRQPSPSG